MKSRDLSGLEGKLSGLLSDREMDSLKRQVQVFIKVKAELRSVEPFGQYYRYFCSEVRYQVYKDVLSSVVAGKGFVYESEFEIRQRLK